VAPGEGVTVTAVKEGAVVAAEALAVDEGVGSEEAVTAGQTAARAWCRGSRKSSRQSCPPSGSVQK